MSEKRRVLPVIMSGGTGTRLWPVSIEDKPKQFHALASELSMIQETARRFGPHAEIEFLPPLVVCNLMHGRLAFDQLSELASPPVCVIQEPFGRNTAAVAVVAASWAEVHAPGALALLLPADHVVLNVDAFRAAIERALPAASANIVTLGVEPTEPQTGYGYIQRGEELYTGAHAVARFVEKPDKATAEGYLASGGYYWNAGIFLYSPEVLLSEAQAYCPEIWTSARASLAEGASEGAFLTLDGAALAACPSEPIDTAIMEKTSRAAVVPCDVGWADVGSWSELWKQGPRDAEDNLLRGEVMTVDTTGSVVWSFGPKVAMIGVSDLVVVATQTHVLVVPRDKAQDVKRLVDQLKRAAPHDP